MCMCICMCRLHAIATRHEVSPSEPPLRQPLPRACEQRVEALMKKDSSLSRNEADRRVCGEIGLTPAPTLTLNLTLAPAISGNRNVGPRPLPGSQ